MNDRRPADRLEGFELEGLEAHSLKLDRRKQRMQFIRIASQGLARRRYARNDRPISTFEAPYP